MDKQRFLLYWNRFAPPVLVILCGAFLLFSPDSASALVSKVFGWCLFGAGVLWGVMLLTSHARLSRFWGAAVCIVLGMWLVNNPLALARSVGRLVGLFVVVRSVQELLHCVNPQGKVLSILAIILGSFLLLVPMTTSRLAFILLGGILILMGITMLVERIRDRGNRLDSGDDPNIIDAL